MLDPRVTGGDLRGILSVYSLSKQSNLAGYRAAFLAGDPEIVARLLTARKHLGLMLPAPVQAAMVAALGDDAHVAAQKERYRARRAVLKPALEAAGFRIDHSEAGLYLWATEGRDAWESLGRLADLGILAGPGHFYGAHFPQHVRLSLTATDERIAAAAARLRLLTDRRFPPADDVAAFGCVRSMPMRPLGCKSAVTRHPPSSAGSRKSPPVQSARPTNPRNDQESRGGAVSDAGTQQDRAILTIGDRTAEFPLLSGTDGTPSVDISTFTAPDRSHHARLRLRQHRRDEVRDHVHRRRPGDPALPRLPDRAARAEQHLPRGRLAAHLRRAAHRRRARRRSTTASATTRSCTRT